MISGETMHYDILLFWIVVNSKVLHWQVYSTGLNKILIWRKLMVRAPKNFCHIFIKLNLRLQLANKRGCSVRMQPLLILLLKQSLSYNLLVISVREVADEHFFPALQAADGVYVRIRVTHVKL